jgi:hypothetical protein
MILKCLFVLFIALCFQSGFSQHSEHYRTKSSMDEFQLVSEKIVPKSEQLIAMLKDRTYRIAGYKDSLLVIHRSNDKEFQIGFATRVSFQARELIYYCEKTREIVKIENVDTVSSKSIEVNFCDKKTINYGYFPLPEGLKNIDVTSYNYDKDFETSLWGEINGKKFYISMLPAEYFLNDLNYYIDITCKKVIINQYCNNIYWCTERDSLIFIYDLDKIQKGNNIPDTLSCVYCLNPHIVGDTLYYSQGFEAFPETGGLEFNIYKSPINDISKKELIAEYVEMYYISNDGNYIIGRKDIGKATFVLIDAKKKKFDYLIGRDYFTKRDPIFYSQIYNQFVVDYKDYFIYINVPDKFLLNSTGRDAKRIANSEIRDKVGQMKHKELK